MRRLILLLGVVAAAVFLAAGLAMAQTSPSGTLDANTLPAEENNYGLVVEETHPAAQTFTTVRSGEITDVQVQIGMIGINEPHDDVIVQIATVDSSGKPAAIQEETMIPASTIPAWHLMGTTLMTATFSNPVPVSAGKKYALILSSTNGDYGWVYSRTAYSGGAAMGLLESGWSVQIDDLVFATYVNTRPTITSVRPAAGSSTADATPTIQATVRDRETELTKPNITLYVDGQFISRTAFAYDQGTDRLTYTPATNLSLSNHTVKIVAKDALFLKGTKSWSFSVVAP
jgi:hypothetical protein